MKKLFYYMIVAVLFSSTCYSYGIVTNTATRDSLSIPFYILDSLGRPVDDATGDSVFITIISPGGAEVYQDSMLFTDGRIIETAIEDYGNAYVLMDRVSDLDGSSTADGVFTYLLLVHDQSLGLQTPYCGQFQIINTTLESALDSIGLTYNAVDAVRDSVQYCITATGFATSGALSTVDGIVDNILLYTDGDGSDGIDADINTISTAITAMRDSLQYCVTATGFSTHSESDVWSVATRRLTELDEDNTTIDLNGSTIGTVGNVTNMDQATMVQTTAKASLDSIMNAISADTSNGGIFSQLIRQVNDIVTSGVTVSDKTGFSLTDGAYGVLADSVWQALLNQYTGVPGSAGDVLYDSLDALVSSAGGTASISDADMGSIADSVWQALANQYTGTPGSFGDVLYDSIDIKLSTISGGSSPWSSNQVDSVMSLSFRSGSNYSDFMADVSGLALEASVTAIRDSVQYLVTASINFDDYTGTISDAQVDNITVTAGTVSDKTGYSLSDGAYGVLTDSVWQALLANYTGTPGSVGDVLYDSIDAQISSAGGVASISDADMGAIIDSLFNRLVSDTLTGTYMSELISGVGSSGCSGNGAYSIYVRILDTAGSDSPVPGVMVYANNTSESLSNPWEAITNSEGYALFTLTDSAKLLFNGYGYASVDSLINATALDTIVLSTYSSTSGMTNVYGNILKFNRSPYDSAIVEFTLVAEPGDSIVYVGDSMIVQTYIIDTADVNGRFDIPVLAISTLSSGADTLYYKIRVKDKYGAIIPRYRDIKFHVPDTSSIAFTDLTRWE